MTAQPLKDKSENVESAASAKVALLRLITKDIELKAIAEESGTREREIAVLGSVIIDNGLFYETALSPLEFCSTDIALFWHSLSIMLGNAQTVDELSLAQRVAQNYENRSYQDCVKLVTQATAKALDRTLFLQYCEGILDTDIRLRGIAAAKEMVKKLGDMSTPLLAALSSADSEWYRATQLPSKDTGGMNEVLTEVHALLGEQRYLKTGWPNFDNWAGGFPVGNVVIWAGLSGEGKTTSLLDTALYQLRGGNRVLIFLADTQGRSEIALKMLAKIAAKEPDELTQADMTAERRAEIASWHLVLIDDTPLTPAHIKRRIMREQRVASIALVIIEGLYLCYDDDMSRAADQALHVPSVMSKMIEFVSDKPYPIIMSHQFKGALANREDKIPTLEDLRGHQGGSHIAQSVFGFVQHPNSKKQARVYCLKHRMRDRNGQHIGLERNGKHGYADPDHSPSSTEDDPPF